MFINTSRLFSKKAQISYLVCLVLVFPENCLANAGVPMIFLGLPFLLCLLIPIVLLEASLLKKQFNLDFKKSLKASFIGNTVSTVLGYPLSWVLLLAVHYLTTGGNALGHSSFSEKIMAVTLQAAWLIPYENELNWMIPVAGIVGLLVAFPITVWSEYYVFQKMLEVDKQMLLKTTLKINLISYSILFLILMIRLATV